MAWRAAPWTPWTPYFSVSSELSVHFREDLCFGKDRRRRLRPCEDAVDDRVRARDAVLLEPEHHVRLARHRPDLDLLPPSDQVVDRVFQRAKSSVTVLTEAEILAEVYR